jgi:hypothetical protein
MHGCPPPRRVARRPLPARPSPPRRRCGRTPGEAACRSVEAAERWARALCRAAAWGGHDLVCISIPVSISIPISISVLISISIRSSAGRATPPSVAVTGGGVGGPAFSSIMHHPMRDAFKVAR